MDERGADTTALGEGHAVPWFNSFDCDTLRQKVRREGDGEVGRMHGAYHGKRTQRRETMADNDGPSLYRKQGPGRGGCCENISIVICVGKSGKRTRFYSVFFFSTFSYRLSIVSFYHFPPPSTSPRPCARPPNR
jgi:hypothetical protein